MQIGSWKKERERPQDDAQRGTKLEKRERDSKTMQKDEHRLIKESAREGERERGKKRERERVRRCRERNKYI